MQIWWWDFITVEEIVKETIKNEGARGSFTAEDKLNYSYYYFYYDSYKKILLHKMMYRIEHYYIKN